jgi:hypothetical protein
LRPLAHVTPGRASFVNDRQDARNAHEVCIQFSDAHTRIHVERADALTLLVAENALVDAHAPSAHSILSQVDNYVQTHADTFRQGRALSATPTRAEYTHAGPTADAPADGNPHGGAVTLYVENDTAGGTVTFHDHAAARGGAALLRAEGYFDYDGSLSGSSAVLIVRCRPGFTRVTLERMTAGKADVYTRTAARADAFARFGTGELAARFEEVLGASEEPGDYDEVLESGEVSIADQLRARLAVRDAPREHLMAALARDIVYHPSNQTFSVRGDTPLVARSNDDGATMTLFPVAGRAAASPYPLCLVRRRTPEEAAAAQPPITEHDAHLYVLEPWRAADSAEETAVALMRFAAHPAVRNAQLDRHFGPSALSTALFARDYHARLRDARAAVLAMPRSLAGGDMFAVLPARAPAPTTGGAHVSPFVRLQMRAHSELPRAPVVAPLPAPLPVSAAAPAAAKRIPHRKSHARRASAPAPGAPEPGAVASSDRTPLLVIDGRDIDPTSASAQLLGLAPQPAAKLRPNKRKRAPTPTPGQADGTQERESKRARIATAEGYATPKDVQARIDTINPDASNDGFPEVPHEPEAPLAYSQELRPPVSPQWGNMGDGDTPMGELDEAFADSFVDHTPPDSGHYGLLVPATPDQRSVVMDVPVGAMFSPPPYDADMGGFDYGASDYPSF